MAGKSLRELIVLFDAQLQQLTTANLVNGFFPAHTLIVAVAATVISAALALSTRASPAAAATPLFSSFASFAALCVAAVMATTLLYRLTGGSFAYSARATGDVVDWLVDAVSRPLADDTVAVLLAPEKRQARGVLFVGLCVVAEVGKVLSFWSICLLLSFAWMSLSAARLYAHHSKA